MSYRNQPLPSVFLSPSVNDFRTSESDLICEIWADFRIRTDSVLCRSPSLIAGEVDLSTTFCSVETSIAENRTLSARSSLLPHPTCSSVQSPHEYCFRLLSAKEKWQCKKPSLKREVSNTHLCLSVIVQYKRKSVGGEWLLVRVELVPRLVKR